MNKGICLISITIYFIMSSWLAALGSCASPKSKARGYSKTDGSLETQASLFSLKRQGSLTDVRCSRKVAGSRSFREKIQDTFEGSLVRYKKAGSMEAMASRGETFGNPDTNMNISTSLQPKAYKESNSGNVPVLNSTKDNFWTDFYNTLPKNRLRNDRPNDLSLQNLPVMETESDSRNEVSHGNTNTKFKGYATSPKTKRNNKILDRMNSAPNSRNEIGHRPASNSHFGEQANKITNTKFEIVNNGDCGLPRSLSLQDEYWTPSAKEGSACRLEMMQDASSSDRLGVRRSPGASPVQVQGHVWIRTKDGSHMELEAVESHLRDVPSPSDSQNADSSNISYNKSAHSLTSLVIKPTLSYEDLLPLRSTSSTDQTSDATFTDPYISPEKYQTIIFDLIQSLNQSPASPEVRRSKEVKQTKSITEADDLKQPRSPIELMQGQMNDDHSGKLFHSEKFIVFGSSIAENANLNGRDNEKREQLMFSMQAHVFHIDHDTKKNWIPASKSAVAVSYYYDSVRHTYRVISVEGSKAIINSTITPNMTFNKTSQKFGQWSDPQANTLYGLGFGTEADLDKFIDKFKEVKEIVQQQIVQSQSLTPVIGSQLPTSFNDGQSPTTAISRQSPTSVICRQSPTSVLCRQSPTSVTCRQSPTLVTCRQSPTLVLHRQSPTSVTDRQSPTLVLHRQSPTSVADKQSPTSVISGQSPTPVLGRQSPTLVNCTVNDSQSSCSTTPKGTLPTRGLFYTRSSSLNSVREPQVQQMELMENITMHARQNSLNTPGSNDSTSLQSQLKYENDKLKLALAQCSSNANKWETELQTLKNSNVRLGAALHESTVNVDEWKIRLTAYRDETGRLKKKISETEQRGNPEVVELKAEISELKDRVETLQQAHIYKDQQIDRLQQRLAEAPRETANGNVQQNKFKTLEEKSLLQKQVQDLQQLLQGYRRTQEMEKEDIVQLQGQLGNKITELYDLHEHILATLRKEM